MTRRNYRGQRRRQADARDAALYGEGRAATSPATQAMQDTGIKVPYVVEGESVPVPLMTVNWMDERQFCGPALEGATELPEECPEYMAAGEECKPFCALMGAAAPRPCIFDATDDPVWTKVRRNRDEWLARKQVDLAA